MNVNFNGFDLIVILGVTQGLLYAGLLLTRYGQYASKRLLALLLLVFSVLSAKILLHTLGLWQNPTLRYFPLAFDLTIQPLLYLYAIALTQKQFRLRSHLVHFAPTLIFLLHAIVVYIQTQTTDDLLQKDLIAEKLAFNRVKQIEDYLSVLSGIVYGYLSLRRLNQYRLWLFDTISDTSYPTYTWLRNVVIVSGGVCLLLTINIVLDAGLGFTTRYFLHWQLFYVYLSGCIYYLAIMGYQQPPFEVAFEATSTRSSENRTSIGLDIAQSRAIKSRLETALDQERVFLDPDLSLNSLADQLNVSPNVLSAVINSEFGKSFRSLINERRVTEVTHRLTDPTYQHLSILGIALDSGFNSEASFYRVFKSITGVSPRQLAEQQALKTRSKDSQKPI
ncbi:AraC family transcriptional regulator [Spirosoma sp. BT702]|uniref:AraC family transcriptional regulator n=1 Tax=Spirosoma profusum TaxID=2771354 RepID=A0A927ARG9_9BACT|nr:helix-turn-helix domain-containing protein [Spirosoma profusum]MBD2702313.1 AraC family transcriptional regulator [Spirosoma profusum]